MTQITEWLQTHREAIEWLASCSLVLLLITLAAVPIVIMKLPENYFSARRRVPTRKPGRFNLLYMGFVILKNLIGFVIIITGLILLFLPGQGIITILIGLALTNFPGKFALERRIVRQRSVSRTLNWIRAKVGKPPFIIPAPTKKDNPDRT